MKTQSTAKHTNVKVLRGKQPKRFLENKDVLSLAASIGEEQETKASIKSERHHKTEDDSRQKPDRKRTSGSKEKLKETKAALKAKLLDAKRERTKTRKQRLKGEPPHEEKRNTPTSEGKTRKSVSFA